MLNKYFKRISFHNFKFLSLHFDVMDLAIQFKFLKPVVGGHSYVNESTFSFNFLKQKKYSHHSDTVLENHLTTFQNHQITNRKVFFRPADKRCSNYYIIT